MASHWRGPRLLSIVVLVVADGFTGLYETSSSCLSPHSDRRFSVHSSKGRTEDVVNQCLEVGLPPPFFFFFTPSLINLVVSVNVKHHVYLLYHSCSRVSRRGLAIRR